ncbi:MAG TPA: SMP-30/gluconolactonase/LRE family protein [Terriglobales bacterium]|nr:SMP-30/gluconolactonase/LRE family protein [Terriglobales bacterium]
MVRRHVSGIVVILVALSCLAQEKKQGRIDRHDPALDRIVTRDATFKVTEAPPRIEGPVWIEDGGYLLFSDLSAGTILKWNPEDERVTTFLEQTNANGITLDSDGRLVWAAHGDMMGPPSGQVIRLEKDGSRTLIVEGYLGRPLNATNDLVFKSNGTLYITDPGRAQIREDLPTVYPDQPRVLMLKGSKLSLLALPRDLNRPNGLAFSPDEKYLYMASTAQMTVWRFDVMPDDTIENGRIFIHMDPDKKVTHGSGHPDGIKVDEQGNVYCAGPGGVWVLSPEGKHLGTIAVGRATNLAFGGSDKKLLFITARTGLFRLPVEIAGIGPP